MQEMRIIIHFYTPHWERIEKDKAEKFDLMECYDIEVVDKFRYEGKEYKQFYLDSVNDIAGNM